MMDLLNLLNEIEKAPAQPDENPAERRDAVKTIASFAAKVAVASLPFTLSAVAQQAKAQTATASAIAALNFALRLEYLAGAFYKQGLTYGAFSIPANERTQLAQLSLNASRHADYLNLTLNEKAVGKPADTSYDLTARGKFAGALSNYDLYLTVAQVLEDTAVRAYKGLMSAFIGHQVYLTAAMNIHSVRARHAAAIRYMRATNHGAGIKPWVSGTIGSYNDTGLPAADAFYIREDSTQQLGVTINGSATVALEAFDEPLTMTEALALLGPFNI